MTVTMRVRGCDQCPMRRHTTDHPWLTSSTNVCSVSGRPVKAHPRVPSDCPLRTTPLLLEVGP